MKKIVLLLLLLSMITTPLYALSLWDRLIYSEVRLGSDWVLVNKFTGKVERILIDNIYEPISTQKGWGGILSDQEMYQARYDKMSGR